MSHRGGKGKGGKGKPAKHSKSASNSSARQQSATSSSVASNDVPGPSFPPFEHMNSSPSSSNQLAESIKGLLGRVLRIELSDGRIVIGELTSIDNHKNIILSNTYQAYIKVPPKRTFNRWSKFVHSSLL